MSTPIRTYAHPATPLSIPLSVWLRYMPPPRTVLEKVQRPPMVVGGGLEEEVCEMKETWSASEEPATSQGQLLTKKGMAPPPRSLAANRTCRIPLSGGPRYDLTILVLPIY